MRAEHIYPFGGWGIFQAGKLFLVMVTILVIQAFLQGRGSWEAAYVGSLGAWFMAVWAYHLICRAVRVGRWIVARL
jgi:hypothetical protein